MESSPLVPLSKVSFAVLFMFAMKNSPFQIIHALKNFLAL